MSISFLFPGQGAQYPGMLKDLPEHPCVNSTIEQASLYLNQDLFELDKAEIQDNSVAVQVCLYVAGVSCARALIHEQVQAQAVAGLSVGAFAAATVCEALSFDDGLMLVKKRAELMEQAFPSGFGMTAVVGLSETKLGEFVKQVSTGESPVFLSNINAPQQMTVSGSLSGLERLELIVLQNGAQKVERLNVRAPSHCALFQPVASELKATLAKVSLKDPSIPYISNVKARSLRRATAVAEDLACNIANGVRWYDSLSVLAELGTELFVEMRPGNVSSRLINQSFPQLRALALADASLNFIAKMAQRLDPG